MIAESTELHRDARRSSAERLLDPDVFCGRREGVIHLDATTTAPLLKRTIVDIQEYTSNRASGDAVRPSNGAVVERTILVRESEGRIRMSFHVHNNESDFGSVLRVLDESGLTPPQARMPL